ncbi:hypothetical protein [Azotobacter salinestris]|uniref:hypothetical protein n=1 Tax=Azotobacter salinestris TaxID=69964 RepID=UPI0032DF5A3B
MENNQSDLVPDREGNCISALELGRALHEWARRHGALASQEAAETTEVWSLERIFDTDTDAARRISQALHKVKITSVAADDEARIVNVMCKGAISSATAKKLPARVHGINISYTGKTTVEANPPATPFSAASGAPLWFTHGDRISCGSSVTCCQTFGAGTLGFLGRLRDGRIVGFSNNHVTGDSNHTPAGMHILSPSPFDASASSPPPLAIGTHLQLVALHSGDPNQISLQELDAAIFLITAPDKVSSIQGNGFYDTPAEIIAPTGGMRVKKVGRTTGLRCGTILGQIVLPLPIPYKSNRFQSVVYFTNVWAVQGDGGNTFSEGGDSGSLVVTLDGSKAVGVIFAGGNGVSYIIPINKILEHFSMTLLSDHNVEIANEQSASREGAPAEA